MSIVARICLAILALGVVIGYLTQGGISGSLFGLFLAVIIDIPVYCITNIVKYNAAAVNRWDNPFSEIPTSSSNDPTQLPKAAYEPHGGAGR